MTQHLIDLGKASPAVSKRRKDDFYPTPAWATQVLLDRLGDVLQGSLLLDPCCGTGAMAKQIMYAPLASLRVQRFGGLIIGDIDHRMGSAFTESPKFVNQSYGDACDPRVYHPAPSWVVTNPPWCAAGDIAKMALQHALCGVALLLRLTWLEPCGASPRAPRGNRTWLTQLPPTRLIVVGRVSYTGDGQSDGAPSAWFVWLRDAPGSWRKGSIDFATMPDGQLDLPGAAP